MDVSFRLVEIMIIWLEAIVGYFLVILYLISSKLLNQGEQPHCGFPEKNFSMNVEKLARKVSLFCMEFIVEVSGD